jgi:hypothetical protein
MTGWKWLDCDVAASIWSVIYSIAQGKGVFYINERRPQGAGSAWCRRPGCIGCCGILTPRHELTEDEEDEETILEESELWYPKEG